MLIVESMLLYKSPTDIKAYYSQHFSDSSHVAADCRSFDRSVKVNRKSYGTRFLLQENAVYIGLNTS